MVLCHPSALVTVLLVTVLLVVQRGGYMLIRCFSLRCMQTAMHVALARRQ